MTETLHCKTSESGNRMTVHTGDRCQTLRGRYNVRSSLEVVRDPGQGVTPPPPIHREWRRGSGSPGGKGPDSATKVSRPRSSESSGLERNVPEYKESFLLGRYARNSAELRSSVSRMCMCKTTESQTGRSDVHPNTTPTVGGAEHRSYGPIPTNTTR
uniref:Uncharacterized protein n=1 Tax=Schizaphis graminum TaxID=13262 RepID=A0A2S2P3A6_SCHGA